MFRQDFLRSAMLSRENMSSFNFFTTTFWEGEGAMPDDTSPIYSKRNVRDLYASVRIRLVHRLPHLIYENVVLFCLQHIDDVLALPVSWSCLLTDRRNKEDNLGEGGGLQVNVDFTVTDDTTLPYLIYENEAQFCLQNNDDALALPVSWSHPLAGETKKTIKGKVETYLSHRLVGQC